MNVIPCRNILEAEFETLITAYFDSNIKIDIDGNNSHRTDSVTIENILNFYVQNEVMIDSEGMVRAFITSIKYARDRKSSTLSRWLLKVRPEFMSTIVPQLMVTILIRKLELMFDNNTDGLFMSEYIKWLADSYCEYNAKQNNRDMLTTFINIVNRKMKNNEIKLGNHIDSTHPHKVMIISNNRAQKNMADFVLSTYNHLSELYDKNND